MIVFKFFFGKYVSEVFSIVGVFNIMFEGLVFFFK